MSRPYPTHTRLGQRMSLLGYTAIEFSSLTGIYPRTLTDILAGRKDLTMNQATSAAEVLGCGVEDLFG